MKHFYLLLFVFINLSWTGYSQQEISGVVTDPDGLPLGGVNISVKNSNQVGAVTDIDGNFLINAVQNDTLIFSYIGFKTQEVAVGNKNNFTVTLQVNTESLDQVVVTALGITKAEKKIGYATQEIETNNLENLPVPNVANLFSGKVAGLQVSSPPGMFQSPSFSLRGKTPLIVIDGIPVETDFFDVPQNNIAAINVLKGTAASALYGSRGRNGAILVTTKSATQDGLSIEISQNVMVSAGYAIFPETQHEYGNGSNGQYEFWDGADGGIADGDMIWGPKFDENLLIPQWNSPIVDSQTGEVIPWYGSVTGTQYDNRSRYSRQPLPWVRHDNLDDFLRTSIISSTNFTVSQKSEKGYYRINGNFSHNRDRVPNSSLSQGGLSYKSLTQLSDKMSLTSKLSYNKVYSPNYPNYGYNPSGHMYTLLIWMGEDVNGQDLKNHQWVPGMEGYRQANWNYAWYNNPWFGANHYQKEYNSDLLNAQLKLAYEFDEHFRLQLRGSGVLKSNFEDLESPKSYFNYSAPREGSYQTWNTRRLNIDYDVLATYDNSISEDFKIVVNAGASTFYRRYQQEFAATDGLTVPGVYNMGNSTGPVRAENNLWKKAINSVYGTLDLEFLNTYFITMSARNDWSSTLPKENRSYFYPSLSGSALISNIFEMPEDIEYVKLFSSWARVSSDLDPYQLSAYYNSSGNFANVQRLVYPSGIVNPNISPETSTSFEVGLNTSFLDNRLAFDATYYNTVDTDQIINQPISLASGFSSRKINGNEYTTNGLELSLRFKPIVNENLKWSALLNWSKKVTKLTEITSGEDKFGNLSLNDRIDSYYDQEWMKSPEGEVILNASTGLPTRDTYLSYLGHFDPDWTFGFVNDFKYKNWNLNIAMDGVWGGVLRSQVVEKMWWGGKHPKSVQYRDEEYAAGEAIYVPKGVNLVSGELVRDVSGNIVSDNRVFEEHTTPISWQTWSQNYPYRARVTEDESETFANVFDRSYLKLRSISLSYNFTELLNSKTIKDANVSFNGYNLFVLKKGDYYTDPDYKTGDNNNIQDPSSRYLGLGVNFKF
ncbi:MAG: SusC/RagA family TonB-linked outer membrane protein [Zunongwangia sp.]|jgi:TonB-linked SusC/RagA family outer membrane protein|uniref:SusC/RagA family TonB-linked outer membrane protein n=1 Tax=Zunongwangia profunda TaxID=398743 RepID=A0A3D5J4N8_9FLAO|nr:SusC/RagA family TonB-linked outer membrane protein [Zunongwangia profunda]MAC64418.1 SusC/RagA family TonB-linked outer membrane protein [Flavobacteriaceae bacterium]MAO34992.1 SusC/RagA family TonB-linked outer membrane protein [Zunongwangia sp.]MAS71736.1 SusC/RagA family TonB-linked outer membrane protein [Zunongwangia sp.]MCC4228667.1 SusC/RagA family TonB-linked outer membrane protein [Zunongwangia profunda]HCV83059.1 SusC/RagA family TonB-linked outer membrane protein [Zunongwangia p|tara:strand:- start:3698 stop:6853 length:3156 start_codon:yes stop_codon:yes gene_type:complete